MIIFHAVTYFVEERYGIYNGCRQNFHSHVFQLSKCGYYYNLNTDMNIMIRDLSIFTKKDNFPFFYFRCA